MIFDNEIELLEKEAEKWDIDHDIIDKSKVDYELINMLLKREKLLSRLWWRKNSNNVSLFQFCVEAL